jgi:hypothetical protein
MNRLPVNGATLLDMRKRKERPAGVTLISLVGFLSPYSNFQLCADPADVYDWTPVAGLEVEVIANKSVPFAALMRQLSAIALATPSHMSLGFTEGPRIDCGEARYALQSINPNTGRMLFDWFPMAVTTARVGANPDLIDAMKVEKRLWSELGNSIAIPFDSAEERIVKTMTKEAVWPK